MYYPWIDQVPYLSLQKQHQKMTRPGKASSLSMDEMMRPIKGWLIVLGLIEIDVEVSKTTTVDDKTLKGWLTVLRLIEINAQVFKNNNKR